MMYKPNMDRKNHRDRNPSCPSCGLQYQFFYKDPTKVLGARCPLILHCGHSICVGCIKSTLQGNSLVKCLVCATVSEAAKSKALQEDFPINVFAVGQIFTKLTGKPKDTVIGFYSSKKKMTPQDSVICVECGEAPSDCGCRQCNARLCSPCFDKLHSIGVTLRKHEKVLIDVTEQSIAYEEALCKEHVGNICQFYCDDCSKYICDICLRQDHLQHSCRNVLEKNKEILQEFTEAYDEANDVLRQLYATQKKLQNAESIVRDKEPVNIEKQISVHFSRLHGVLQLQEEALLKEIRNAQSETRNSVENIVNDIETNIKEMQSIINQSKALLDEKNLNSVPLCSMLEKLKNISAMPCHLLLNDEQETTKFELSIDSAITKLLKEHCTLIVPSKRAYELCSKFDLPDSFPIESIACPPAIPARPGASSGNFESVQNILNRPSSSNNHPNFPPAEVKTKKISYQDVLRKNRLSLQLNNVDVSSVASSDSDIESFCSIVPLTEGSTEIVILCHLIAPNTFYVQRKRSQNLLGKLRESFSKQANIKRNPPAEVYIDTMYLVVFARDKKWYRGRVMRVSENSICEVFYVDYGNTETVHISKLREIPQHYTNIPGQAIRCMLHGCVPYENEWSEDAVKLIASMSNGVEFSMYIERNIESAGIFEVNLRSVDDTILSVTDVLIYLGYAHKTESTSAEEGLYKNLFLNSNSTKKTYFKDVGIQKQETFDAQITHINTPTNFYVQKLNDGGQQLIQLMKDLKQTYSALGPNEQLVYSPTIGLPVAAKFKDGDWYRAVVLSIPMVRLVQVQYVDFGNIECVDWLDIRTLQPTFLRMSMQGIKCALCDITPKHPKGWSVQAKKAFENMAKKKTLFRVFVENVEQNQINVVLYESQRNKDICFNGLMVKKGHANSVGPSSAQAEFPSGVNSLSDRDSNFSTISSVTSSQSQKTSFVVNELPTLKGLESVLSDNKVKHAATNSSTKSESSPAVQRNGRNEDASRVKVKVLKVVTPGEVYLTFENNFKRIIQQTVNMTEFYNSTDEEDRSWEAGDLCAVLRLKDNKWHRGRVESVSSNRYKVYIKDIVDIVEVDSSGLRNLRPEYMLLMDGSVKCHLSGVVPPSGSQVWPHFAIDHLKLLATESAAEYYITQMGDIINDSMPVQFWRKTTTTGGALEPTGENWIDLSLTLISMGYVLPDVKSDHYTSMKKHYDFNNDATQNVVVEWLRQSYEVAAQSPFVSDLEKAVASEKAASVPRQLKEDRLNNITDWKPAEPFKTFDFVAIPSYVDFECAIYIQDQKSQATLELIQRALGTLFAGSVPKPHDLVWSKGQLCIAFYETDGRWYRGKVLLVKPEYIEVLFVDYGNVEFVQPEDLRKQITMGQISIQCHRCLTEGVIPVSPDGKWPVRTLDFIHATIVTQECRVVLNSHPIKNGIYTILKLIEPSGQDLMEVLLSMHYATYIIDCNEVGTENIAEEEIIQEPEPEDLLSDIYNKIKCKSVVKIPDSIKTELILPDNFSDGSNATPIVPETQALPVIDWFEMIELTQKDSLNNLAFKELILPDSLVEIPVEITLVTSCNTVKVNIFDSEDPEISSMIADFGTLHDKIQGEAEDMPYISHPTKGLPCVGCFTEDNTWYRAVIMDNELEKDLVSVYYVDYGNYEKIPIDRLRAIKEEWIEIPKLCLQVTLINVCKGPHFDRVSFLNLMSSCFIKPPYVMTIEARQPSLQVELYNNDGQIAYQSLLDLGLLAKLST